MLRIIVSIEDAGKAANVGGSVDREHRTFDVDIPKLEAVLVDKDGYRWAQVIGVEVLPKGAKEGT